MSMQMQCNGNQTVLNAKAILAQCFIFTVTMTKQVQGANCFGQIRKLCSNFDDFPIFEFLKVFLQICDQA
jgi:hypothetical protein